MDGWQPGQLRKNQPRRRLWRACLSGSEASGDQGWLGKVELRYALAPAWQLATFVDHGQVRLNKDVWSNGDNHRSLSGAGVGATWAEHGWHINAVAPWKQGNADAQSDVERSPRVWAQVVRYF